jgi:hypothetical protein
MSSAIDHSGYDPEISKITSNQTGYCIPQLKNQYHKFNSSKPNLEKFQMLIYNQHYKEISRFLKENMHDYHKIKYKATIKCPQFDLGKTWMENHRFYCTSFINI